MTKRPELQLLEGIADGCRFTLERPILVRLDDLSFLAPDPVPAAIKDGFTLDPVHVPDLGQPAVGKVDLDTGFLYCFGYTAGQFHRGTPFVTP